MTWRASVITIILDSFPDPIPQLLLYAESNTYMIHVILAD